jgi:adenylate cyclase
VIIATIRAKKQATICGIRLMREQLARNPEALQLGGESRDVTILFADIRNYSTVSEAVEPESLINHLNVFLERMTAVIMDEGGMVNEILGDAILAAFGAPLDLPHKEEAAVRTAERMLAGVQDLNAEWEADGFLERWRTAGVDRLEIRIGIHTGKVVVGNIGGAQRIKYAVIGDTVNIAARVEALNKELGTSLLFTAATAQALGDRPLVSCGTHSVKGRAEAVEVYTLPPATPT